MANPALEVRDLTARRGTSAVLSNFTMSVAAGEVVAIMGPSGSGKTTLLSCLTGTLVPGAGYIRLGANVVSGMSASARSRFRRRELGLVFQFPELLPELSVEENVAVTLLFDGVNRATALDSARNSLESVGLSGHENRRVDELSGGEAQRVALARALVRPGASAIIADEPTASLDAANATIVADLLVDRSRSLGCLALVATHDLSVAQKCDRIILVREGHAAEVGT